MLGVPRPGPGHGPGPQAVTGQEGHHDFADGQKSGLGHDAEEVEPAVALQHRSQFVPPLQGLQRHRVVTLCHRRGQRFGPAGHDLPVPHTSVRGDHDARSGDLTSPREVEILPHGDDPGVKATQLSPQVGPNEHAGTRRHEDVAHRVVLPVVDLAVLDPVDHRSGLVAAHPDVKQDGRVVPIHELRRDDAGIGTERFLHHVVHHVVVEGTVVMAQQEEGRPLDHVQRGVGGGAVPEVAGELADEGVGQDPADPFGRVLAFSGGQDEHRKLLVVLPGQGGQGLLEPRAGIGGDHYGNHCRCLDVHQGHEAIRSLSTPEGR